MEKRAIHWNRSSEGYCDSKCGRFSIVPEYQGTCSPQAYRIKDKKTGRKWSGDSQRDLKSDVEQLMKAEAK